MPVYHQHPVFDDLMHTFSQHGNRVAIVDKDGQPYTYNTFKAHISGAYAELAKRGVKKGSKVLVAVPMSLQLYAVLEALFALGATAVFLDPWMKGKKMSAVIRQVKPDLFVVTKKLSRITWLLTATWSLKKWKITQITPSAQSYSIARVSDEDNALITFTSGTSGTPKGANRSFAFLHAQAEVLKAHLGDTSEGSVDYSNFPIVGLANFALGNTVVIPKINLMKIHQVDPEKIVQDLIQNKVNRLVVSPSLLQKIVSALPNKHSLQTIMTGGAPIPPTLIRQTVSRFPDLRLEAIYGSTEAEPICITDFTTVSEQLKSPLNGVYVGQPVAEINLKIITLQNKALTADDLAKTELPEETVGEIIVTGQHVNQHYFQNEKAFKRNKIVDQNGVVWHRTGDLGYLSKSTLFLTGRHHRVLERNGKKYYPYPVEQWLAIRFDLTDTGYVQNQAGLFCLYYYSQNPVDQSRIQQEMEENSYPVDRLIAYTQPLPRDARHRSKLQIDQLKTPQKA